MAKPDASEEEMREVLSRVNLLGFLEGQKGIKTELLEKAENLSGGQRQRLALAKALLHDSPVYILTRLPAILMQKVKNSLCR